MWVQPKRAWTSLWWVVATRYNDFDKNVRQEISHQSIKSINQSRHSQVCLLGIGVFQRVLKIRPLQIFSAMQDFFESAREARRLLAIMCIGFLANHRLCKHSHNQLVRVYQCYLQLFKLFSFAPNILFDGLIFSKQFWIIDKWSYSTVKKTNEAQYAYGYTCICLLLENHMVMR